MLNIGPGELIMICVIALIVLGPDKLPQAMRTTGQVVAQLRRMSSGFQQDLTQAFQEEAASDRQRPSLSGSKGNGQTPDEATESAPVASPPADEAGDEATTEGATGADEVVTSAGEDEPRDADADGNPHVA